MTRFGRKILNVLLAFSIFLCLSVRSSCAATAPATITVVSGGLVVTVIGGGSVAFSNLTLNGTDQTVNPTGTPTIRVIDATGSNAGWNVTFTATDFISGANTIPNTNFSFNPTGGSLVRISGQAVDGTNGPKEAGGGSQVLSGSVKALTTSAGYGKGKYDYTPATGSFSLTVPATTLVGTYTSTLTITLSSGP